MSCCGPKKKGSARPTTVHFGENEVREISAVETSSHQVCPETVDDGESSSSSSAAAGVGTGRGDGASSASSASASESLAQPRDLVPGLDVYKFCMITRSSEYVPKKKMLKHRNPEIAVIVTLRFHHGTALHNGHSSRVTGKIKQGHKYRTQQPLLVTGFQLIGNKDLIKRVEREFRKYIVHSSWDTSFVYKLGEFVEPTLPSHDDKKKKEIAAGCGEGIHFFFDKKSAIEYSGIMKGTMAEIRT